MLKHWLLYYLCLCPLFLCAQTPQATPSGQAKDFFHQEGMKKVDGILPVYQHNGKVYLEFPRSVWGREVLISAQIDRGFDLVNRPAKSLGVVQVKVDDNKQVTLAQPSYADRMPEAFKEAVIEANEQTYPAEAVSPEGGIVIDVTKFLSTGSEWFSYSYTPIRGLDAQHASVTGASAFADGVCFHIQRRHGYSPERANVSSAITMLPEGSMPLWLSCTVRVLPADDMSVRLMEKDYGFQSLTFGDHMQDPYMKVTDSLMIRWRMEVSPADKQKYAKGENVRPLRPLTLCVDRHFPERFRPAVREAVAAWNNAFLRAGFRDALQLKELAENDNPATCQALLSYDLGTPDVERSYICHPRTGEILSCRINVGHGCTAALLDDYWWQEDVARNDSSTAVELLKGELLCAIGDMLGMRPSSPDPLFLKSSCTLDDSSAWDAATGYRVFPDAKDCYEDRDQLRQWRKENRPKTDSKANLLNVYAGKLQHLQKQFRKLDKTQPADYRTLYKNGMQLYGRYVNEIARYVGSDQPETMQQEAMNLLAEYFFEGSTRFDSPYIRAHTTENRHTLLSSPATDVFAHLLSQQTVATLQRAEWYAGKKDKGLTAQRFFQSLYASLFGNFEPDRDFTYEQLDLMLSCMEAWKNSLNADEKSGNTTGKVRLETEWKHVKGQLEKLAESHPNPSMRSLFAWMSHR